MTLPLDLPPSSTGEDAEVAWIRANPSRALQFVRERREMERRVAAAEAENARLRTCFRDEMALASIRQAKWKREHTTLLTQLVVLLVRLKVAIAAGTDAAPVWEELGRALKGEAG